MEDTQRFTTAPEEKVRITKSEKLVICTKLVFAYLRVIGPYIFCGRLTDVLRRSKSRAMKIELDTARATAQEEVIHILVERERSQVHKDMNDALEMLDSKFITQMAELDKCENEARNKSAAATISSAAYRWYKRRNLFP